MNKPFSYLQQTIKNEMSRAIRFIRSNGGQTASSVRLIPDTFKEKMGEPGITADLLWHSDNGVRSASLLALNDRKTPLPRKYVVQCFALAFDDPDPLTRGFAWVAISALLERGMHLCEDCAAVLGAELNHRFGVVSSPNESTIVTNMWLDAMLRLRRRTDRSYEREARFDESMRRASDTQLTSASSTESALPFLNASDPTHRIAALALIGRDDNRDSSVRDMVRLLVEGEREVSVRFAAIAALARLYRSERDAYVLQILAELTLNESLPSTIRFQAYEGLFVVYGASPRHWPTVAMALRDPTLLLRQGGPGDLRDWPDDQVDWQFVERCKRREL